MLPGRPSATVNSKPPGASAALERPSGNYPPGPSLPFIPFIFPSWPTIRAQWKMSHFVWALCLGPAWVFNGDVRRAIAMQAAAGLVMASQSWARTSYCCLQSAVSVRSSDAAALCAASGVLSTARACGQGYCARCAVASVQILSWASMW